MASDATAASSHRFADICDILPTTAGAPPRVQYEEGARYDSLFFGAQTLSATPQAASTNPRERTDDVEEPPSSASAPPKASSILQNTVLLVPDLLSAAECASLVDECEQRVRFQETNPDSWLSAVDEMTHDTLPFERHEIKDLSSETRAFFQVVLRERLLPFVSEHLPPDVEAHMWEDTEIVWEYIPIWNNEEDVAKAAAELEHDRLMKASAAQTESAEGRSKRRLAAQHFKFSESEPTINRYTKGGRFIPHRDALALTVNVLLSDEFTGGGTQFWEQGIKEDIKSPALCLLPRTGVGIIFNGTVLHAGRAVTGGIRHLLVASFSVIERKSRPETSAFVKQRRSMRQAHGAAAERLRKRLAKRRADAGLASAHK